MGYEIGKLTNIPLGYKGENGSRTIRIDMTKWVEAFAGATFVVEVVRPDKYPYFPATQLEDGILSWTVSKEEVDVPGKGWAQIEAVEPETGKRYKSRVVQTIVYESLSAFEGAEPGDPAKSWVQEVVFAANRAEAAVTKMPVIGENGNWWVWDADAQAHVDSGVLAEGKQGDPGYTPQKGVDYFDGEDGYTPIKGVDYFDGKNGTSVTVSSVRESTEDGGINVVTFSDGKELNVKNGQKGDTGVGIQTVTQTTTSTEDGGENIVTVTKTDGSTSTFAVRNGKKGQDGKDGTGVTILGSYTSEEELKAAHPTGNAGDAYLIDGYLYVWSASDAEWKNVGKIQGPAGYTPVRGVDYWTEEDQQSIVNDVLAALPDAAEVEY